MRNLMFATVAVLAIATAAPAFAAGGGGGGAGGGGGGGTDDPMPTSPQAQAWNYARNSGQGLNWAEATNRTGQVATDSPAGIYGATQAPSGNNAAPEYLGGNGSGH